MVIQVLRLILTIINAVVSMCCCNFVVSDGDIDYQTRRTALASAIVLLANIVVMWSK